MYVAIVELNDEEWLCVEKTKIGRQKTKKAKNSERGRRGRGIERKENVWGERGRDNQIGAIYLPKRRWGKKGKDKRTSRKN